MSNTTDFSWSDMPIDILTSIAEYLSPTPNTISNLFHFASVCKTWRQASFLVRVRRRSCMPWLINGEYEEEYFKYQFSDFWYKQTLYSFEKVIVPKKLYTPLIADDSKDGWLLFQTSENINPLLAHACFFFFNPFRKNMAVIEIPDRMNFSADLHIAVSRFTTAPTCPDDCHIFVFVACTCTRIYRSNPLRICRIYTCNLKEGEWRCQNIHGDKVLIDVAYMDGAFYCVFSDEGLIVSDIFTFISKEAIEQAEADDEQCDPFLISSFSSSCLTKKQNDDFLLVEADGDLLLTICSHDDSTGSAYCHVYRFDPSHKEWNRITNLGNRVLFLCSNAGGGSTVVAAVRDAEEFANTIFVYRGSQYEHYICGRTEATWILDKTHRLKSPEAGSVLIAPPTYGIYDWQSAMQS